MSNGDPWADEDAESSGGPSANAAPMGTTQNVKSVSELTHEVKELIEGNLRTQWVGGEVSNCRPARSGHVYFTLKDDEAQMSAVIWRRLPRGSVLNFETAWKSSLSVAWKFTPHEAAISLSFKKRFRRGWVRWSWLCGN